MAAAGAAVATSSPHEVNDENAVYRELQQPSASQKHHNENVITDLVSPCSQCLEPGKTEITTTSIPHYLQGRQVIVLTFKCPECGYHTTHVQETECQDKGLRYECTIKEESDLQRRIVKSKHASVQFPELEFEIPAVTQQGVFTTLENLMTSAAESLEEGQPLRRSVDPETASKLDDFIGRLKRYAAGANVPFTVVINDPSGNSFIEDRRGTDDDDPQLVLTLYSRTAEQEEEVKGEGQSAQDSHFSGQTGTSHTYIAFHSSSDKLPEEVMKFPVECYSCSEAGEMRVCITDIPNFKEVIIMTFICEECGWKNVEIKSGGAIPEKGRKVSLKMDPGETMEIDLRRDLIKGDKAAVWIPELDIELEGGTLGGMYTTVEGLLHAIKENLVDSSPFSSSQETSAPKECYESFIRSIERAALGEISITLCIIDPMANSFIADPTNSGSRLLTEEYVRSAEEDEALGITNMDRNDAIED
eukprot:gb/GECG01011205.1/.p1 GENE.gb/GECG01011205.1/~~gb/GECG01011205.1/.p1  ORF type:complete len:474 (+),score=64.39 gb/GECG01011205.1/:1-1422(+)